MNLSRGQFWPYFYFVDFRAYFGHFSHVKWNINKYKITKKKTAEDGLKSKNARKQTFSTIQFYMRICVTSFNFGRFLLGWSYSTWPIDHVDHIFSGYKESRLITWTIWTPWTTLTTMNTTWTTWITWATWTTQTTLTTLTTWTYMTNLTKWATTVTIKRFIKKIDTEFALLTLSCLKSCLFMSSYYCQPHCWNNTQTPSLLFVVLTVLIFCMWMRKPCFF